MNINKILKDFKSKQLSYQQYLNLAQVPDTLTAFIAYQTFKDNPYLTSGDIINFKKNLKNKPLSNLRSPVMREILAIEEKTIMDTYCNAHIGDAACSCYMSVKKHEDTAKKMHDEFTTDYNKIQTEILRLQREYNEKDKGYTIALAEYNNFLSESFQHWELKWGEKPEIMATDDYVWHKGVNRGNPPLYDPSFDAYYTESYKKRAIDEYIARHKPQYPVLPELPLETIGPTIIQCCNNTLTVNNRSTASQIIQSCNQNASIVEKTSEDEANKRLENEAKKKLENEAKKKLENEAKKKLEDEAVAKRKKVLIVLLIMLLIVLLLIALFIYIYNK